MLRTRRFVLMVWPALPRVVRVTSDVVRGMSVTVGHIAKTGYNKGVVNMFAFHSFRETSGRNMGFTAISPNGQKDLN